MLFKLKCEINWWLAGITLSAWAPLWLVKLVLNIQIRWFGDCNPCNQEHV